MARRGIYLNVGSSGVAYPGMENIDRQKHHPGVRMVDIRLGLPYATGSVEVAVAAHVLEHLHPFYELPPVLKELRRVLMPGGVLRVAVPDLKLLTEAYINRDPGLLAETQSELKSYVGMAFEELPPALQFSVICFGNNSGSVAYDGHYAVWDGESLCWLLGRHGFLTPEVVDERTSRHPGLLAIYRDTRAPEQVIVEACKPLEEVSL